MPPEITRANLELHNALVSSGQKKAKVWREKRTPDDRYGRRWCVWIDTTSRAPVGLMECSVSAPVDIPQKFLSIPEDKPWRLEIDWAGYARELKRALAEWEARVKKMMRKLHGDRFLEAEPTAEALKLAGPKPQDWRVVALAARGDPWCLGLQKERTAMVRKILGEAPFLPQYEGEYNDPSMELSLGAEFEREFGAELGALEQRARFADERDASAAARFREQLPVRAHVAEDTRLDGRPDTRDEDLAGDAFDDFDEDELGDDLGGELLDDDDVLTGAADAADLGELTEDAVDRDVTPRAPVPVGQGRHGAQREGRGRQQHGKKRRPNRG